MGGVALHKVWVAEMKTGEGKTLTSTLPVYLNALGTRASTLLPSTTTWPSGTPSGWARSTGPRSRDRPDPGADGADASGGPRTHADITYGTNNEFGFDYLRDNMVTEYERLVQRGHYFAVVDEVDSILIDEARTPLIISGAVQESTKLVPAVRSHLPAPPAATRTTRSTRRSARSRSPRKGSRGRGDPRRREPLRPREHRPRPPPGDSLKAKELYKKDVEYVVKHGEVLIVDEFTGRILPGRRYSEGLHQAIEAKEGVRIKEENQTLATITLQNYFRMYDKLSGMTGTAQTEAAELGHIYKLDVAVIPTNRPWSERTSRT